MAISDHMTEADLKAFCAGTLPARATILCAEHLESCAECSRLFAGVAGAGSYYRPFKLQIPKADDLAIDPEDLADEDLDFPAELSEASSANLLAPERNRKGWRRKLTAAIGERPFPRLIPLTVAAAAIVALIILAWFVYQRRNITTPRQFQAGPGLPATPQPVEKAREIESPPIKDERALASPQPATGKRLQPNKAPRLTVALFDRGRWVGLDSAGRLVGALVGRGETADQPAEIRDDVAMVLRGEKIGASKALNEVANADINQRGNDDGRDELTLLTPIGTLIKEDRPILKWRPMNEATGYVVKLVDDSFNPVAESPTLSSPEWQVEQPLKRDTAYIWQVTAYRNDEAIERNSDRIARFKVISEQKLVEIEIAGRKIQSSLALAVFYAREGLLDDAEQELEKLFSDPQNAALAEKTYRAVLPNRIRAIK